MVVSLAGVIHCFCLEVRPELFKSVHFVTANILYPT